MKVWSVVVWAVCGSMMVAAAACDPQTAATRTAAPTPVQDTVSASATSEPSPAGGPSASASAKPSASAPLVDFATLGKDAASFDGKRVRVVGEVFAGAFILRHEPDGSATLSAPSRTCTELECDPSTPCCNRCASAVSLRGNPLMGVRLVDKSNPTRFTCSGNECSMTCTPPKGRYEAVGTFRLGSNGELDLEVESITPVP